MANAIEIEKILPIYKVEKNSILSMFGDITIAYEVTLPEIFTLSDSEYEAFHRLGSKRSGYFHSIAAFINRIGT